MLVGFPDMFVPPLVLSTPLFSAAPPHSLTILLPLLVYLMLSVRKAGLAEGVFLRLEDEYDFDGL